AALGEAEQAGADLAVFPELAVSGYPPEDLLLKPGFVADNMAALESVAGTTRSCAAVIGFVDAGRDLHNAAAVCASGSVMGVYHKRQLPNYSVFDEQRYFAPGVHPLELFEIAGVRVGISICEDAWNPVGPISEQAAGGAELIVNINASPYSANRLSERASMLSTRASDASCPLVYVNQVGGQDELVFDGGSMILDDAGRVVATAPQFEEAVMVVDIEVRPAFRKRLLDPRDFRQSVPLSAITVTSHSRHRGEWLWPGHAPALAREEEIYQALALGTHDYVAKNGFSDAVIGLSGGIDSSLVATIAVDALGSDHVHGVAMPSRYSSESSISDAVALSENLGIDLRQMPIEAAHAALVDLLDTGAELPDMAALPELTEENLQSRIRGVILMGLSNSLG
ncbi:MAG: NAD(+) synthase, partial [Acidimicrobiales bacterium]